LNPLTNSEMARFQSCRRGWYISYYLRLRRIRDYASLPSVGNFYHHGLEVYYNTGETDVVDMVRYEADALINDNPDMAEQINKDAELAQIMLTGYFEWLEETGADEGLSVIGAEQAVEVGLGETGYRLRGKIDTRLERDADGAWLQLENKTVANLGDIPKYAQAAPQFLTYDLLAFLLAKEEKGRRTDGVIINMARRVKRTPRAKPPFYDRWEVRHSVEELRSHYRHVVGIGRQIEEVRHALDNGADHHTVCPPKVDRNHIWACPCAPLTPMMDDGSDWKSFVEDLYEEYNPWQRYEEEK